MEQTFVALKPDGVQRSFIGEVISRFEKKGFKLIGAKFVSISKEQAEKHYEEHKGKDFFDDLIIFLTSGPIFAMAWEGKGIVASVRKMLGKTNPLNSEPGTIRGDLSIDSCRNAVHASSDVDAGKREISIWFSKDEVIEWKPTNNTWIYE